jgi:acyl carrier protein
MKMIEKKEVLQDLNSILLLIKPDLPEDIPPEDHLKNDWGLESFDLVEFVARIEYHYKIAIQDEDFKRFDCLNSIALYLADKL